MRLNHRTAVTRAARGREDGPVKRWVLMIVGVLLVLLGLVWTGQGLDLFHQTGGMNGHKIFAVIGIIVAVIGLVLVVAGSRTRRPTAQS